MSKLHDLDRDRDFDLLVLDTPPSRNALDFLDAPDRLTQFLEGRALQGLLRPTGLGMRMIGRGTGSCLACSSASPASTCSATCRISSARSAGSSTASRSAPSRSTRCCRPSTVFLLVTSPEREPIDEAIFFRRKLKAARHAFGGVLVNRVHHDEAPDADPEEVAAALEAELGPKLAAKVSENFRDYQVLARRDHANIERLAGKLDDRRLVLLPYLDEDVHDAGGLARINRFLFASDSERERLLSETVA